MAATYTTSIMTVMGDQRVFIGTVHLNDGDAQINFANYQYVNGVSVCGQSAHSAGINVVPNSSAAGYVDFESSTSGDSINVIVWGK